MYTVDELFKNYATALNRTLKFKMELLDSTLDSSNFNNVTIEDIICKDELQLGTTMSSILEFETRTVSSINAGDSIKPYMAFTDDNGENISEWLPLGVFYVDTKPEARGVQKYTCYDMMNRIDRTYTSTLVYPASMQDILNEIMQRIGTESDFECNSDFIVSTKPADYTYKQVLGFIASSHGGCAKFNKDGKFTVTDFTAPTDIIPKKNYTDQTVETDPFTIAQINMIVRDDFSLMRGQGESSNTISVINPLANDVIIDYVYNKLNGLKYYAMTLNMRGLPYLETGDYIEVADCVDDSNSFKVINMRNKPSFDGGLSCTIESFVRSKDDSESLDTSDMEKIITGMWHAPNYVYNSSFGRFDENLKPDYWDTDGVVSKAYSCFGDYSLYLTEGQHCYQKALVGNELLDGSKWPTFSTRYAFRILGRGKIKVKVLSDGEELKIKGSQDSFNDESTTEANFEIYDLYWHADPPYITLEPNTKVMQLCIECTEGYVYIDGIIGAPNSDTQYSVVFQDGKMTRNDKKYILENGNPDAEIGDIWFRSDTT